MKRALTAATVIAACLLGPPAVADAATTRSCDRVSNPYPGTRFEGVDLTRIKATGLSCSRARRVARGAHRKALATTPNESGVLRFRWNGYRVTGDLRGDSDRYVARRGSKRVRWRF